MDYATMHETESAIRPKTTENDAAPDRDGGGCGGCGESVQAEKATPVPDTAPAPEKTMNDRPMASDDNSALWFIIGILIVLIILKK